MTFQRKLLGILILVIGVPVIGLVVGSIINVISLWRYSTLVSIFSNCGSAILAAYLYRFSKIESVVIAVIFGLLVGFAVYVVHLNGDYNQFVTQVSVHTNFSQKADARQTADAIIKLETGSSGLWGYLQYEANCGIILSHTGGSCGTPYKGWSAWVFIILDMLIYLVFPIVACGGYSIKVYGHHHG